MKDKEIKTSKGTRIPKQKRSIEKREKIITVAYNLFMDHGYFNTSTVDIAKAADLSVGVFYSYFEDKKDILLVCLQRFEEYFMKKIYQEIESTQRISEMDDIVDITKHMLLVMVKAHASQKRQYHDEVKALELLDDDIKKHFIKIRNSLMEAFENRLKFYGYRLPYHNEQVFLIHQMISGIEDELVFKDEMDINHDTLINQCAIAIKNMLVKDEKKFNEN